MELEVKRVKIVVTIPPENTNHLREKIGKLGAGKIGEYTYCTTSTKSVGTFLPSEKANPYIGQNKKLETVEEDRLEFICEVEKVKKVIQEIRKKHPYEEPAIDIYPLLEEDTFL